MMRMRRTCTMAKKQTSIVSKIDPNLEWLKDRAEEIKREVESQAYDEIEDRIVSLMGSHGPSDKVAATKEIIQKARREALKDYAQLHDLIKQMEETEEAKVQARGGQKLSSRAAKFMSED